MVTQRITDPHGYVKLYSRPGPSLFRFRSCRCGLHLQPWLHNPRNIPLLLLDSSLDEGHCKRSGLDASTAFVLDAADSNDQPWRESGLDSERVEHRRG